MRSFLALVTILPYLLTFVSAHPFAIPHHTHASNASSHSPLDTRQTRTSCTSPILPGGYRYINIQHPRSRLHSHAARAIKELTSNVNTGTGQFRDQWTGGDNFFWASAIAWQAIAIHDRLRGGRGFYEDVRRGLGAMAARSTSRGYPALCNEFNDDSGWAGLAAVEAAATYGDALFLSWAKGAFEFILKYGFVSQSVLDRGYVTGHSGNNLRVTKECRGTMLGGVFWKNDNSGSLNAVSTGNFALLGAELCKLTKDERYCRPARQAVHWIHRQMLAQSDGLVMDNVGATGCGLTGWRFTYNQGLYVASYALLSSLPGGTAEDVTRFQTAIRKGLVTGQWNDKQGLIMEIQGDWDKPDDGIGFKAIWMRALQKAHPYIKDAALKDAVTQYVNIQLDAMVHRASNNAIDPSRYGRNWTGPKYQGTTVWSQIAALDTIIAAQINPASGFPTADPGQSRAVTKSRENAPKCS